ncbi:MAG: exodeoxyribonuclease III [Bacteroidota bacterium]|nr:exodeoxyribonuclease III [Bacteroidota bacterium]
MKLVSWNVNGIRAIVKKNAFFEYLEQSDPDILCLQETKAHEDQLDETLVMPPGYYGYWHAGERRGYSGTATLTKKRPIRVARGTEIIPLDTEGRVILTEYRDFLLYNVYFPNGGQGRERLEYKLRFYDEILEHFERVRAQGKPIIFTGDVNTAHKEIDLKNPKENENTSGFLPVERAWIDRLVELGWVDTFRYFHPDEPDMYSWWDMRTRARERNAGWRIDYFFVTPDLVPVLRDASIEMHVMGSDHAPIVLVIDL